jgi:hypothetical protein
MKDPRGNACDINIDEDVEEEGGVETEEVVLEWLRHIGAPGMNASELANKAEMTHQQAHDRLVNLWENDFLRCEDEGENRGTNGRFFLLEGHSDTEQP